MKKIGLLLGMLLLPLSHAHATNDGTPSTGSFTVVNVSSLAAASATGTITMVDTANARGTSIYIGPYLFRAGTDWQATVSLDSAAIHLAAAINASNALGAVPVTASTGTNHTVALTAQDVGTYYNGLSLSSSNSGEVSVSGPFLTGGQNNATVKINAIGLTQGTDWFNQDVASNTAVSLASAINQNPKLRNLVSAVWTGGSTGTVYLRAILSPQAYTLSSSDPADLTVSNPTMTGGTAGNIQQNLCFLGAVDALPTANYPAGCMLYLNSDATHIYISTQAVTGAANAAANSWLAK